MRRGLTGEKIVNLCLLLVSAFYLAYARANYKFGTLRMPKEGFLPTILGVGMVLISGFLTVQAFLNKGDASGVRIGIQWWRFGAIVAVSLAYALGLSIIGYPLGTFLFLLAILKLARVKGWLLPLALSAVVAVAFYLLFKLALGVLLPAGFIGL